MSTLRQSADEAMERLDEVANCWMVIGDLMTPETDLHTVDRDNLACALGFLQREYQAARANLDTCLGRG